MRDSVITICLLMSLIGSGCAKKVSLRLSSYGTNSGTYQATDQLLRTSAAPTNVIWAVLALPFLLPSGRFVPAAAIPWGYVSPSALTGWGNARSGVSDHFVWINDGVTAVFIEE